MREEGRRPQRAMPQALLCLRMANVEVAVALGVEIVEDSAVVCAQHADGLLREEAAVGERGHCVAVLLQNLAERGIACFFIIKSPVLCMKNPYKTTAVINICSIFVRKSKEIWRIHT